MTVPESYWEHVKKVSVGHKATRPTSSDVSYDLGSAGAWFLGGLSASLVAPGTQVSVGMPVLSWRVYAHLGRGFAPYLGMQEG